MNSSPALVPVRSGSPNGREEHLHIRSPAPTEAASRPRETRDPVPDDGRLILSIPGSASTRIRALAFL